jgi:PPIC-type PPIASE domain
VTVFFRLLARLALVVACLVGVPRVIEADGGPGASARAQVVARVGPRPVTRSELEDRLAGLAAFQRATFGATPRSAAGRFLTDVLVREELLSLGAAAEKLDGRQPAAYRIERARSAATIRALRARLGAASAVPEPDVERYYEKNRSRYDAPERYQIWRILCRSREEAQSVLDAAKRDATPASFAALAREHSLDKGTYLRSGNVGFVTADGASNEPGLRIDAAVVRAAQGVRDGELVASPVTEGDYFSVVWRRGTVAAIHRALADVEAQIRDTIWRERLKEETDKLVSALRATKLRDLDTAPLASIDLPPEAAEGLARSPSPPR